MELNSLFLVCVVHLLPVLTSHTLQTHWNASPAIHPDRRGQKHYTVKKKKKKIKKNPQNFQYTEGSTGLSIVEVKQWGFSHCRCFWLVPTGTRQILLTMALFNYRLISFSIGFFVAWHALGDQIPCDFKRSIFVVLKGEAALNGRWRYKRRSDATSRQITSSDRWAAVWHLFLSRSV